MYARRLRAGGTNARPNVRIVSEGPGVALLDGDHGDGHVVGHRAMEIAIAKARACGIGACTVRNSEHFGIAAYYAMQALAHGMIGFATGNSSAIVPPPGGRVGRVGNNATAYALPTRDEPPVVLDIAMSIAARARFMQHVETDRPIPEGWALDGDGLPTTDARAASEGALLPIGGYKGFGLALLWDALSGVLSGGRFGIHVSRAPDDEPHEVSHFMLALDPAAFGPPDDFRVRMDEVVRTIRETPRQPGVDRVRAPGERAAELRSAHLAEGIALPRLTVDQVNGIAEQLGIPDRLAAPGTAF